MKKSILIIDDELALGEVVQEFLEGIGYETFVAIDAQQGLAIAQEERPSVILLDVLMPQVSGLECLAQIKEKTPESIVIMISGMQDESIAKEAIEK
jgi:two-component system NtrC family response regulator